MQQEEPQYVRERHPQDHQVAEVEHVLGGDDRAEEGERQKQDAIGRRRPVSEDVRPAPLAVVRP